MLSPQDCKPKVSQVRRLWFSPLWFRGGPPRSGKPKPVTSSGFYMLRGHSSLSVVATRWKPPVDSMPKRLNAALSRVPVAGSDPFESMESRRRRLFPDVQPPPLPTPVSSATERASEVTSFARSLPPGARISNRNDAPVQHTTRRGSLGRSLDRSLRPSPGRSHGRSLGR